MNVNKEAIQKHGVPAGIAFATALAVSLATAPDTPTAAPAKAAVPVHASAPQVPQHEPQPEVCQLAEGTYPSREAVNAAADGCIVQEIHERPFAMLSCEDERRAFVVRRSPVPNERRLVSCTLVDEVK